jgi:hypothetical protein
MNKIILLLIIFIYNLCAFAQDDKMPDGKMQKVCSLYDCMKELDIKNPKTVLAMAVLETGWLDCKHCSLQYNNLFGFRSQEEYMHFATMYDCLCYFKRWQVKYYDPWKVNHPKGTYYDFLKYIKFAAHNDYYIARIKVVEHWLSCKLPLDYPAYADVTETTPQH